MGDELAWTTLVRRYQEPAFRLAYLRLQDAADAEDVAQEAFIRAYRARTKIDPDRPFYTWFYQILRRLCFNHVRDRRRRRQKLDQAGGWIGDDAAWRASLDAPEAAVERDQLRHRVQEAIRRLGDREREVLVLKEFEGLRYREIAELLQIPIGTVMSRLYTARRKLADLMELNA